MIIRILGAAAGGGVPQWNCACANCMAARRGGLPRMTQSSVAVSADGVHWAVLNASSDIRAQLTETPALTPAALRGSPVCAVVVTNADVDHIAGLLTLREMTAFDLFASAETHAVLAANPVFGVLDAGLVARREIALDAPFSPASGLTVTAFAVPGKVALFLEKNHGYEMRLGGQTVGLKISDGRKTAFYIPGCAALPPDLIARLEDADLLLFDGTVWADDDMVRTGTGAKTGGRMGHMPVSGPGGSMAALAGTRLGRRVFIHINNTNPMLDPASPERAELAAAGWEVAQDGTEYRL